MRSAVVVLVTGISLYLLLPSLLSVFSSWRSLQHLTWYWALLALLAEAGSFVCLWQLNRIALHEGSWFTIGTSQLAGNAVGKIVPGGGATSTAFTIGMLRRAGVQVGQAAASLTAASALQIGTKLAVPLLAVPAIAAEHVSRTASPVGVSRRRRPRPAGRRRRPRIRLRPASGHGRTSGAMGVERDDQAPPEGQRAPRRLLNVRDFVRATIGRRWKGAVVSASGSTALDFIALLCMLKAIGAQPQPSLIVLAYASAGLLALIPLTPGGLGFVEAGLVGNTDTRRPDGAAGGRRDAGLQARLVLAADSGRRHRVLLFRRRYP